jgi:dipeptidyl aminopeptidase/acylaminoacyl peptidase
VDQSVIKDVCWTGEQCVKGPVKGVVMVFHGLGAGGGKTGPSGDELEFGAAGGLVVYPYSGPWSWMNAKARAMADDLIDAVYAKWNLPDSAPLICTGGSMGGLSSLLYTRYARRPVAACYANCPVCDIEYHFNERPDLPTTIRYAADYAEDMTEFFRTNSPLRQVGAMPDIPYLIVHGGKDMAVSKTHHSDPMVAAMRGRGLNVEYIEVPEMGHCGPMPLAEGLKTIQFVLAAIK